uniref:Uncharacterized protein n=1 Tax=Nelumbo nucifera TaxID=4432 RepID=A0A822ZGP8_NELNU|nr:TPA_asm: hypothetical protein HUJ06_000825 [Nelumbo nucifera]
MYHVWLKVGVVFAAVSFALLRLKEGNLLLLCLTPRMSLKPSVSKALSPDFIHNGWCAKYNLIYSFLFC